MKSKDLKIIAVILAVSLVFTVIASNAVSVASIVFLAKNEIAKQFGIKTAEPIFQAQRKCKDLVILPPLYDKYEEYFVYLWRCIPGFGKHY